MVLKRDYKKAWSQFVHLTFQNSIHSAVEQQTVSFSGGFTTMTVKFIYYEKATKFCKISTIDLSYVATVKFMYGGDFPKLCGLLRIYEL